MSASARARDDKLDRVFHCLADRTRRSMLARLAEGPATVTELAEPFDMSLPAASKHIRVLEDAGLLSRAIDGRLHRCSLDARALASADAWLAEYRQFWNETLDALAAFVEVPHPPRRTRARR